MTITKRGGDMLTGNFFNHIVIIFLVSFLTGCLEINEGLKSNSSKDTLNSIDSEIPDQPNDGDSILIPPSSEDTEIGGETLTPSFLATGHQGSSMYSCDGGLSWKGYRELDSQRCNDPNLTGNCAHKALSGKGVVWTPSGFVLHYGHGSEGPVLRSENGQDWQTLIEKDRFADVAYGNSTLVLFGGSNPLYSDDDGDSFTPTAERVRLTGNARAISFVPHGPNGLFIAQSHSGVDKSGIAYSSDLGRTFTHSSVRPMTCSTGGLSYNGSRILVSSEDLCFSDDGAVTWTVVSGAPFSKASLFFDGRNFKAFADQSVFTSADGITWSKQTILVNGQPDRNFRTRVMAYNKDLGKYVSIHSRKGHYENTGFFHSEDGVNWTQVTDLSMRPVAPHPVKNIASGYLKECTP